MKDVFQIFNIESKKEREISIGDIKYKITYGKNSYKSPFKKISRDYICIILDNSFSNTSVNIYSIEKEQIVDKIKIDYLVKNIFPINEKNFIIVFNKNEKGSFLKLLTIMIVI